MIEREERIRYTESKFLTIYDKGVAQVTEKIWLKNYPEQMATSLDYREIPLQHYLTEVADRTPDNVAIHFMGKDIRFKELREYAYKFANYLKDLGLQKGDRVAIMLPNTPQAVISFFGAMYAGCTVVMTNPLYTEREVAYQLKDSGAKLIVTLDILYPRIMKVWKDTELENIVVTGIKDFLPFPKNLVYPFIQKKEYGFKVTVKHGGNTHLFPEILRVAPATAAPDDPEFDFYNDLVLLQYTGGTTGFPKGVMLTHRNIVSNVQSCELWTTDYHIPEAEREPDVVMGVLPFFHVYGMTTVLTLSVMMGFKMLLVPKFDATEMLKTIDKHHPTLFPGAPTIYIGILNHPDLEKYDLSSIKACISGSAPLPVEIQDRFEAVTGGKLVEGYGLTESSPVTHSNFLFEDTRVKGSIGVPWPDTDAAIMDVSTMTELPIGEVGELCIKGPQVMKGYWNRPEETEQTLRDGWLLTGDMGYMDENGYFFVVDRKKDIIIAGGYNIYPREVEEVLYEHEAVQECVVVGVPDPYRGETVKAFIVLKEGATATNDDLNTYCRKNLAPYKVPRIYEFREELPKTAVGKILRRQLVDEEKAKQSDNLA